MEIPPIALGTWKSNNPDELKEAIRYAVEEAGYRHIDCAACYENEKVVGEALKELFDRGVVKREELWITSKLWCTKHKKELVEVGLKNTLADLQLDYLDLYLMHYPCAFKVTENDDLFPRETEDGPVLMDTEVSVFETWKAMEELVDKKLCRYIGVSNFSINMLERLKYNPEVKIQPYANQIEYHLYMQQGPLIKYLKENGILFEGYSPLGTNDWRKPEEPCVLEDPVLNEVATEVKKSVGQVALRFLQQNNPGCILLAKSVHPERIKMNIDLGFDLSDDQIAKLKGRERVYRFVSPQKNWGCDVIGDGW